MGWGKRTVDRGQGALEVLRVRVANLLADDGGKLNLVVHVNALGTQHGPIAGEEDGRGRLEEEEGLLGLGAVELLDVVAAPMSAEMPLKTQLRRRASSQTHA
jgi:hypothetical protein